MPVERCDFCAGSNPRWSYPAKDVRHTGPGGAKIMLTGGWAACDACHGLIERGDRNRLAERGARVFRGISEAIAKQVVVDTQKLFWDNRTGDPRLDEDA